MDIADAQRDMRLAFYGGGPGMVASALMWLAAGVVALAGRPVGAMLTLFFGGMFIHPIGVAIAKILRRSGRPSMSNPLTALAMEVTILLLLCIPLAFAASFARREWFFPAMLLIIGGRYLTFSTLYGLRLYWACGAALAASGLLLAWLRAPFASGAFIGAAIDLAGAAFAFAAGRREPPTTEIIKS